LAQQIADRTVTFDDLRFADDKGLRALLEKVDRRRLHVSLRGADDELLDRFLANLSQNAGAELTDALENAPPQRRSEVNKARTEIVKAATHLLNAGTLVLQRPGTREKYV
jgi:flagellar motor switch protein FliG